MPTYTNNVPQANQQIAATQGPIQNNFDYIQKAVGQEHNFLANDTDPTHAYHLKASMPNSALAALPAGTNGQYRVDGGIAKYFDGATDWWLNMWTAFTKSTFNTANVNVGVTIATLPANTFGLIYIYNASIPLVQSAQFVTDTNKVYAFGNVPVLDISSLIPPIQFVNSPSTTGVALRAFATGSAYANKTYTYIIIYRAA